MVCTCLMDKTEKISKKITLLQEMSRVYTKDDVLRHSIENDLWVTIRGKIYDISKFVQVHPGGIEPLLSVGGGNATYEFLNFHSEETIHKLHKYEIGVLDDYSESALEKDYMSLRESILREGLFVTNKSFYILEWSRVITILLVSLYFSLFMDGYNLIGAALLGIFWQQLAFSGHDAGHNAITHVRDKDSRLGLVVGNLLTGISMTWWKNSHNIHHINPNCIECDPDIQHLPLFAVADEILGSGFYSIFHKRWMKADYVALKLISVQHILFYPIMFLARFNLYIQSLITVLSSRDRVCYREAELITLGIFWMWFSSLVYASCNGSLLMSIAYILISHGVAGILHVQICLSHFSMLIYSNENCRLDWVQKQCLTTLNIDCSPWVDWFHGGLQFQLEHHLFPRLPRHNLRNISHRVKALCNKHKVDYHSYNWINAQISLIKHLRDKAMTTIKYQ